MAAAPQQRGVGAGPSTLHAGEAAVASLSTEIILDSGHGLHQGLCIRVPSIDRPCSVCLSVRLQLA